MNPIAAVFALLMAIMLLVLPRRWAPMPLMAGACYMTLGQGVDLGPFTFSVVRLLIAVGGLRVILRGERLAGGLNSLDALMVSWSLVLCLTSAFHRDPSGELITRLGTAYDACGIYFLLRIFCASIDDLANLCQGICVLLVPVALEMFYEHLTFHNLFSVFGGVPEIPQIREGRVRAFGPFTHPILAGTVGAVVLPLMVGIGPVHRTSAIVGTFVCLSIVFLSASSGPFMSAAMAIGALLMWSKRRHMRLFRWAGVGAYMLLGLVMSEPVYYLIARLDVVGGSTGWHRARLIESAFEHLDEWWFAGTDYTRHWMPSGVSWSADHSDITNHYLHLGVLGGFPVMLVFILILARGFSIVGRRVGDESVTFERRFLIWALGCALFAQAATCISVSYFDQSVLFLYLTLAAIGSASYEERSSCVQPVTTKVAPTSRFTFGGTRQTVRHGAMEGAATWSRQAPSRQPARRGHSR